LTAGEELTFCKIRLDGFFGKSVLGIFCNEARAPPTIHPYGIQTYGVYIYGCFITPLNSSACEVSARIVSGIGISACN